MPYQIEDTTDGAELLMDALNSFWMHYEFGVNPSTGAVTVTSGYFAFYYSYRTSLTQRGIEPVFKEPGETTDFTITQEGEGSIVITNSMLMDARKFARSNEVHKLFLFEQVLDDEGHPIWFDLSGWNPAYNPPTMNSDSTAFQNVKADFGNFSDRHVHYLNEEHNGSGMHHLGMILPLLNGPMFQQIIGAHGDIMPEIKLSDWNGNSWQYFHEHPLPGAPKGFVSLAQGGFKALNADKSLPEWLMTKPKPEELANKLMDLIVDATPFPRNLENVDDTFHNGVVGPSPDQPVETVFVNALNTNANEPVPGIVV